MRASSRSSAVVVQAGHGPSPDGDGARTGLFERLPGKQRSLAQGQERSVGHATVRSDHLREGLALLDEAPARAQLAAPAHERGDGIRVGPQADDELLVELAAQPYVHKASQ